MSLLNLFKTPAARVPRVALGSTAIVDLPDPDHVVIPLEYPGQIRFRPAVQAGDSVARGQVIGRSELGNCVHASISGLIKEIRTIWSASGYHVPAVVITRGDAPALTPTECLGQCGLDLASATRIALLKAGGVISPWTTPGQDHREADIGEFPDIQHIVVKGLNEEPTIVNFELLMVEGAGRLKDALQRLCDFVPRATIWLTVARRLEPWARETFEDLVRVVGLAEEYRHRIERMVVPRVTGVAIANTEAFRSRGVAVLSVEHLLTAADALAGKPFTHKTATIAGGLLREPVTVRTPVGTTIGTLLASQGMSAADYGRLIVGGPMRGMTQYTDETPLSKFQHGVLVMAASELPAELNRTCVNCGRCTRACPVHLQVHLIGRCVEYNLLAEVPSRHPEACHECGLCAFVCPAHRPLVQMMKIAKRAGVTETSEAVA